MKPNELMIEDWVYRPDCYDQVKEIRYTGIIGIDSMRGLIGFSGLKPIPLTPEILEKCGFKKQSEGIFLLEDLEGNYWVKFYSKDANYTCGAYSYIDINSGCMTIREMPMEFLHELQHALRLCGITVNIEL